MVYIYVIGSCRFVEGALFDCIGDLCDGDFYGGGVKALYCFVDGSVVGVCGVVDCVDELFVECVGFLGRGFCWFVIEGC